MRVGNDVVDLRDPDNRPGVLHRRFDTRVFTASERDLLATCPDTETRHALRWTLWAAKESTLKLMRKRTGGLPFRPSEFEVRLGRNGRSATVAHRGFTAHVRLDRNADRVHAVATERRGEAVVSGTERIDPALSPASASARVRENAAVAAAGMLAAGAGGAEAPKVAAGAKIPRVRRGGRQAPVDVSVSHDGSWLAHALVHSPD